MTGQSSSPFAAPSVRSFRDPGGFVIRQRGRFFRVINPTAQPDFAAFLASAAVQRALGDGDIVRTEPLPACPDEVTASCPLRGDEVVVEHAAVPFPSYPHEWPPEMLHAAGVLTLDLALAILSDGLGLKDATPYNVMFRGAKPVFLDVLSFERRTSGDPIWLPEAQFIRTFLLPLMVSHRLGTHTTDVFLSHRDGLEPESVFRALSRLQRLAPGWIGYVSLPTWLGKRRDPDDARLYRQRLMKDDEQSRFVLRHRLRTLRRRLDGAVPKSAQTSVWSSYMESGNNYTQSQFALKERFVADVLRDFAPRSVLDVGCNTGHFSKMAAQSGASVVAIDLDPVVVGRLWREAHAAELDILPLVVNLSWPSPALGWLNDECSSFLDRAHQRFDLVQMLAVVHHMVVTERVPLAEILRCAASITRDLLLIEYVGPEDSMFRRLTRGREGLHRDFTQEAFETTSREYFEIVRTAAHENSPRRLYLLRRKHR